MIGIYKIENKVNGKVYVGQSINIEQRWGCHRSMLRHNHHENQHLQNAWNKYGDAIGQCCVHETLSAYGYIWKYKNDPIEINDEYIYKISHRNRNGNKPFLQLDKNGNVIQEYYSLRDAIKLGYSERMIYECYNGKRQKYRGYIWCLVKDKEKYTPEVCKKILND